MNVVSCAQMRELDRRTIEELGTSGEVLMDRAGLGVAEVVEQIARLSGRYGGRVLLFAGKGNNGGDAFAAARYLNERGFGAEVWLAGGSEAVKGDARIHLNTMRKAGISLRELPTEEEWRAPSAGFARFDGIVVDGVLGTGISGAAAGAAAEAIRSINVLGEYNPVVAIDVPSGMNADTGEAAGEAVRADVTVTMGFPKSGLLAPRALDYVGRVEVVDIGIPEEWVKDLKSDLEMVTLQDVRRLMRRRAVTAHKGMFGHVLIVGGAAGYAGAMAMAAEAAARSGAGLVTVLTPSLIAPVVAGRVPEAMVHFGSQTETGSLKADCLKTWGRDINGFDAILLGPGMTTHEQSRLLVENVLKECRTRLVMDADALNVCEGRLEGTIGRASCPVVITPHPGEMARLLGCSAADVQADRLGMAAGAAGRAGAVVVLKGAGTVIAERNRVPTVNMTGNPGMATGGMGDILGGLIAGFVAQGHAPFQAACIAVYLHGRAGDLAAWRLSQAGMIATDVIEDLLHVIRQVAGR